MTTTLYDKLGGSGVVRATVTKMYEKILCDDRVSVFFCDTEMPKLRCMMIEFASMAFGAPLKYTGKDLRNAHKSLVTDMGLTDRHFDIVLQHLRTSMTELKVDPKLIEDGLAIVESVRGDVLNK